MTNYRLSINGFDINRKKLSHEDTIALIDRYQKTKDDTLKEALIIDNTKLVLSMMKRFYHRCDSLEDLFQVGMIGLMKAIDNFNTSYQLKFSTYAVPLIIGEMKRYIRDDSKIKVSRGIRDIAYKVLQVKDQFLQNHHREPSIQEIADNLKIESKEVIMALYSTNTISSLQEELSNDDGNVVQVMDQLPNKEKDFDMNQSLDLHNALNHLNDKQKKVIQERYFYGKSQMEIAQDLFVSQAQVSRIEKQALKNLHKYLLSNI